MAVDDVVKVLDAFTRLIAAIWLPVLLAFVLWKFGPSLRGFFRELSEFTFKGAGFEASAKRRQAEAAGALVAAAVSRPVEGTTTEATTRNAQAAAAVVTEAVTPRVVRQASEATVLWVDDNPENNVYERQALEAVGVSVTLATSTDEALDQLRRRRCDLIITDMSRPPDTRAGYTLLNKVRSSGDQTPLIIYAGSSAIEHRAEAREKGALGSTDRPDELFRLVVEVIGAKAR